MDKKSLKKKSIAALGLACLLSLIIWPSLAYSGKRLEIMGFYLGMTVNDAVKNLNKLNISNYNVMSSGISFGKDQGNWLQVDANNKVGYMLFTYRLFDAQDLYLTDFVNKFTRSYHLPTMKYDSMRDAYVYQTKDCEVLIPSDPMGIVIIQVIPQPEFNING